MKNKSILFGTIFAFSLLNVNADINDDLQKAVRRNDAERIKEIVSSGEEGLDVNLKVGKYTPLELATLNNSIEAVGALIESGVDINAKNQFGETALSLASGKGYKELVEFLVEKGADINQVNEKALRATALMSASYNMKLDVVEFLVEQGADLSIRNFKGQVAVDVARGYQVINYLKESANKDTQDSSESEVQNQASSETEAESQEEQAEIESQEAESQEEQTEDANQEITGE